MPLQIVRNDITKMKVDELIAGIAKTRPFDMGMLEEIVRTDGKQRYSFNADKTLIRANQGHSIPVDVEMEQKLPPDILWRGFMRLVMRIREKCCCFSIIRLRSSLGR